MKKVYSTPDMKVIKLRSRLPFILSSGDGDRGGRYYKDESYDTDKAI